MPSIQKLYDVPASVENEPAYNGKILKNEVQDFKEDGTYDTYYEYLEWTSDSGGNYSVYKKGENGSENTKQTTLNSITIPEAFTYDSSAKTVSVTVSGKESKYFLFKSGISYITATEKLDTETDPVVLWTKWRGEDSEFIIAESGNIAITPDTTESNPKTYTTKFSMVNGFLSSENTPIAFFYVKNGDDNELYYNARKATVVVAVGRQAVTDSNVINVKSNGFLLMR